VGDSAHLFFLNEAGELHVKSPLTGSLGSGRAGLERLATMAIVGASPAERVTRSGATEAEIARIAEKQRKSGIYGPI
jgi:hypothetical protein